MKNNLITLLVIGALLSLLTACPYASSVPIDTPAVKVQNALIGKWVKVGDESNINPNYFIISKQDDFKYRIAKNEYNSYDSTYKETIFISHISKIDNYQFMNMQQDGAGDYFLYKLELNQNDFSLFEITDNIDEKFNTSPELKNFVKKNMELSFFYNKDEEKYNRTN